VNTQAFRNCLVAASATTLLTGLLAAPSAQAAEVEVEVIASGLNSPRQLAFSPRGDLYVAEAGLRGNSTNCSDHPLGRFCLERTGSLARVGKGERVERVVSGLPSISNATETIGPFDIAFRGRDRFALTIGLGGSPEFRERFGRDGARLGTIVTGKLRHHQRADHARETFDALDFEAAENGDGTDLDSNPTGIVASGHHGYVYTDAGGNPGFLADAVPTDVVVGPDGAWYVSQLVGFPFEKGSSTIWRVVPGRSPRPYATGLTNVTSLAFHHRTLYAVELASNGLTAGPSGALVKVKAGADTHEAVASDLPAPYGLAIRKGSAYVTTGSLAAGSGRVVKVGLP
jgi:hypothetical protein